VYGQQRRIKITKRLEELFNLPDNIPKDLTQEQATAALEEQKSMFADIDNAIDKIDQALPKVKGLDASDKEMDELADLAKNRFNDLMDLGMNMEARFSGQVFQTAGVLLGHAITAKQAKLDKKLRMVDLQLKKMRLDHQLKQDGVGAGNDAIDGQGILLDRNALLAQILNKPKQ
jgi:hypothetical protein